MADTNSKYFSISNIIKILRSNSKFLTYIVFTHYSFIKCRIFF